MNRISGFIIAILTIITMGCNDDNSSAINPPGFDDYFPISVGREFNYSGVISDLSPGGTERLKSYVTLKWSISSREDSAQYHRYIISQSYLDTLRSSSPQISSFIIYEHKESSLLIIKNNVITNPSTFTSEVKRFYTKSENNSVKYSKISNDQEFVTIKKDSGIVSYTSNIPTLAGYLVTNFTLVSIK